MEHVISPTFIYLLMLIPTIKDALIVISLITLVLAVAIWFAFIISIEEEDRKDKDEKFNAILKRVIIIFSGLLIIGILLPDRKTMIGMYVADKTTYNTISKAGELTKDIKDEIKKDIIEIIREIERDSNDR